MFSSCFKRGNNNFSTSLASYLVKTKNVMLFHPFKKYFNLADSAKELNSKQKNGSYITDDNEEVRSHLILKYFNFINNNLETETPLP